VVPAVRAVEGSEDGRVAVAQPVVGPAPVRSGTVVGITQGDLKVGKIPLEGSADLRVPFVEGQGEGSVGSCCSQVAGETRLAEPALHPRPIGRGLEWWRARRDYHYRPRRSTMPVELPRWTAGLGHVTGAMTFLGTAQLVTRPPRRSRPATRDETSQRAAAGCSATPE
jgi:hypothetical protein